VDGIVLDMDTVDVLLSYGQHIGALVHIRLMSAVCYMAIKRSHNTLQNTVHQRYCQWRH